MLPKKHRFFFDVLVLGLFSCIGGDPSFASVIEDGTTQTNVQSGNQIYQIDGGTRAGDNLLHSFQDFSVETGWTANFTVPSANITNVITRVTGKTASTIDGTLQVDRLGHPVHFFLMNPNGIVFGKNARLNLLGSFVASTAEGLQFSNGWIFSTKDTAPLSSGLVLGVPLGLQLGSNPAAIQGDFTEPGSGLQVVSGQTLALIGGDLRLSGAGDTFQQPSDQPPQTFRPAQLKADGGQVILASVGPNEGVNLFASTPAQSWSFDFTDVRQFQDVTIASGLRIGGADAMGVELRGRNIRLDQQVQIGEPAYLNTQMRGKIWVVATNELKLSRSIIVGQTIGPANGSDITIQSSRLNLEDESVLSVSSDNPLNLPQIGNPGNITVVSNQIGLDSGSSIQANSTSTVAAGNINIQTQDLRLNQGAFITSESQSGQGGNLDLTIQNALILRNSSKISTSSTTTGNGGNVAITAGIIGAVPVEDSNIVTNAMSGKGGTINIVTQGLFGIYPNINGNLPNSSDITAKSESGVDGIIDTNILTTNTAVSVTKLPIQLMPRLVRASCFSNQSRTGDRFVNAGQGGLPSNPSQVVHPALVWQDLRPLRSMPGGSNTPISQELAQGGPVKTLSSNGADPILEAQGLEAQGWVFQTDGSIRLVREPTIPQPMPLQATQPSCLG